MAIGGIGGGKTISGSASPLKEPRLGRKGALGARSISLSKSEPPSRLKRLSYKNLLDRSASETLSKPLRQRAIHEGNAAPRAHLSARLNSV